MCDSFILEFLAVLQKGDSLHTLAVIFYAYLFC